MLIRAGHSRGGSHASKILWFFETGHKQAKMVGGVMSKSDPPGVENCVQDT